MALAVVASVLAYLIGLTLSSIYKVAMIYIAPIGVAIAVVALSHRALSWLVLGILAILLGLILQLANDYGAPEKPVVVLPCGAVGLTCVAVLPLSGQVVCTLIAAALIVPLMILRRAQTNQRTPTPMSWRDWLSCWAVEVVDDVEVAGGWLRGQYLYRRHPAVDLSNEEILRRNDDTSDRRT